MSTTPARLSASTVVLMTESEARSCVRAINRSMEHARELLLDLYEREGWRALGYRNWRVCVMAEFQQGKSRVYQLLTAARIDREISTFVENPTPIPEAHLRPLAVLETPEERREVWAEVVATAPDGIVTERHVRAVVTRREATEQPERTVERRTLPACASCLAYTNPDNWYVTERGAWTWVGSEAPPHLRLSAQS